MAKLLIADDNKQITSVLSEYAKKEGHTVEIATDGVETIDKFKKFEPDLILLDVMMPRMDGFEVCRNIRRDSNVPIIMITARGEDFEKIMGLDIGADDYIVKPFSCGEVMARVRAILRRLNISTENSKIFTCGNLTINLENYMVEISNKPVRLTKKEIEILWTLASAANKVFSRDLLLDKLWGFDFYGDSRTVDSHIKRLRAKLEEYSHEGWEIETIWGVGYKFAIK
ncbi:MAG: response regulator transcription factor [Ruminococcaceae bacterium]|nr:response regulator transcription factor [Oscillospiraceae bacterium]